MQSTQKPYEMDSLEQFFVSIEQSFNIISTTGELGKELEKLDVAKSELRRAFASLLKRPDMSRVQAEHVIKAGRKRSAQVFQLDFRGGGETEYLTSWHRLAKRMRLSEATIRVYLSSGKGQFSVRRYNPTIGELDMLTIARLSPIEALKRPAGRPPKFVDWERLGPEAPGNPNT